MPLVSETVNIPIAGGIDQELDERILPVGSLITAKNVVWNKRGAIDKRPGFTILSNASKFVCLASTGDDPSTGKELCAISKTGDFYGYNQGAWTSRGRVSPCSVTQSGVWTDIVDWAASDMAESAEVLTTNDKVYVVHSACGSYHSNSPSSEYTRTLGVWAEIRNRSDEVVYPRQLLADGGAVPSAVLAAHAPRNWSTYGKLCTGFLKYADGLGGVTHDNLYVYEWLLSTPAVGNVYAYDIMTEFGFEIYQDYTATEKHFNVRTYDACRIDSGPHVGGYILAFIEKSTRSVYLTMRDSTHAIIHPVIIMTPPGRDLYSRVSVSWDSINNLLSVMTRRDAITGQQTLEAWTCLGDDITPNWGPIVLDQTIKWDNDYNEVIDNIGSCVGPTYPAGANGRHVYLWGRYAGEPSQQGPNPLLLTEWHIGWVSCCTSLPIIGPVDVPAFGFDGCPSRTRNTIPKSKPFTNRYGCYMVIGSCYFQEQTGTGCAKTTFNSAISNFLSWAKIDSTTTPPTTEASCTRVDGSWTDDGFTVGMVVTFINAPHNNAVYHIRSVSHKTMVFEEDIVTAVLPAPGEDSTGCEVIGENAGGNQTNPGEDRTYLFEHTSLFEWRSWDTTAGLRDANTKLDFVGCWDIGLGNGIENSTRIYSKNDTMRIGALQNITRCQDIVSSEYQDNSWAMADVRRSDTTNANERVVDVDAAHGNAVLDEINYGQQHRFISTACTFDFDATPYIERTHRNLMLIGGATINCYDGLRIGDLGFAAPPVLSNWIGVDHAYWLADTIPPPARPPYPHINFHGVWYGGTEGVKPYTGYHYVTMWMSIDNRGHLHRSMPSNQIDYTWNGNAPVYDPLCGEVDKYDDCDEDKNLAILSVNAHALGSTNRGRNPDVLDAAGFTIGSPDGYASCYWFRSSETGISHRIGDPSTIRNNHVWKLFGSADLLLPGYPDSGQVLEGPQLYTDGGEIEAVKPESSRFVLVANERVWIAGQATPERIQYSKKYGISGGGLCIAPEFNEGFSVGIPSGRACTGLSRLDDKVIVFSSSEVYAIAGQGPLDDGSQNDLSQLTLVTDSFGCIQPNSVLPIPDGVLFHARTGMCMLNRDLSVTQVYEIETLLGSNPRITDCCLWPEKTLAVFCACNQAMTRGVILVYDFHIKAWSYWEILGDPRGGSLPVTPLSCCVHGGELVVSTTGDGTYISDSSSYRDHSTSWYTSTISTAWVQAASQSAWQRIRGVIVQSKPNSISNRAGLTVNIYNDFQSAASQTCTWTSADMAALPEPSRDDLFVKPLRQKCSSIKIEVSDVEPIAGPRPDASFSICGFALDLGVKKGLSKVDKARRQ